MSERPESEADGACSCNLCAQIAGWKQGDLLQRELGGARYVRRVVLETRELAVIPSLGPLVEGHVLVVPKVHARSFAQLGLSTATVESFLNRARSVVADAFGADVQMFEHGTGEASAQPACSVEHAHLHLVPCGISLGDPPVAGYRWEQVRNELELRELVGNGEYLRVGSPSGWLVSQASGGFPSQLLRKVFAEAIEAGDAWDWREHPRPEAVRRTFRQLSEAAL